MTRPPPEALATFQSQRSTQHRAGQSVTVAGVAALARVDRSYIYDLPTCSNRSVSSAAQHPSRSRRARSPSGRRSPPYKPV